MNPNIVKTYIPMGRSILVRGEELEATPGGLILPSMGNAATPMSARIRLRVLEVGPKCEEKISVGDILMVSSGQVTEVKGEDKLYFIHETQVVGVMREVDTTELPF